MSDHSKVALGFYSTSVAILTTLAGMKRLDTGAFVKEYESENKEYEQALQMTVSEVISEDPRFIEKEPPPISEEFEIGSKVFFLGDHAYGVAAQVSETSQNSLAVMLAVSKHLTIFMERFLPSLSVLPEREDGNRPL